MNWLETKKDVLFAVTYISTSLVVAILTILASNALFPEGHYKVLWTCLSLLAVTPILLMLGIGMLKMLYPEVYG